MDLVLCPAIFMATTSDTPARTRFRIAVRLKSCEMRPGREALLQAVFQALRVYLWNRSGVASAATSASKSEEGRPRFEWLVNRAPQRGTVIYYVFDLISLDGKDLRQMPLENRKAVGPVGEAASACDLR